MRLVSSLLVTSMLVAQAGAGAAHAQKGGKAPVPASAPAAPVAPSPPPPTAAKPWSVGVSQDQQDAATKLFEQGLASFEVNDFAAAAKLFEQALTHWNHPGIHFNLTVCLVNLDRPMEAYEHVVEAMKYEQVGLADDKWQQATTYKRLLEGRLVFFEVETRQEGVTISLDGAVLLRGPGSAKIKLLPGPHALVATKDGYDTLTKDLTLTGGAAVVKEAIELKPRTKQVKLERRWSKSLPWKILGAGVGIAVVGGGAMFIARKDMDTHRAQLESFAAANCVPDGCTRDEYPDEVWDLESRAKLENNIGIGLVATGGAVILTSVVMAIMNSPREVEESRTPNVVFTSDGANHGVAVFGRF